MASEHPNLAVALAAFQAELPEIVKGSKGKIEGTSEKTGQRFSYEYDYADLGPMSTIVLRLLGKHGIAWTAKPTMSKKRGFVLRYALKHGASGEKDKGYWPLPEPARFDIKKLGGIITYSRRYCLMAVTGVAPVGEDQDAQGLDEVRPAQRERPGRPRPIDKPRNQDGRVRTPVPGPDHERLVHTGEAPMRPWDGDDLWIDQPTGEPLPTPAAERRPRGSGRLSPAQAIAVHFKRLGVTDDTERLVKTTILANHSDLLTSTNDLDEAKQREISDELAKCRDRAALDALLAAHRAEVPS